MAHGDGSVVLNNGVLYLQYYVRGKRLREPAFMLDRHGNKVRCATKEDAAKVLRARVKEKHADEIGALPFVTPATRKIEIKELCSALRADFELRGKFSAQNKSHLARVEKDFGDKLAMSISPAQIDTYISSRLAAKDGEPGDRPATVNRTLQMLGQCFTLAVRNGTLNRQPYIRHLSEADNVRTDCFEPKQLEIVIANLPADLRDFVRFSSICGMRRGELSRLRWDMLRDNALHIPGSICKNAKGRVLGLSGELLAIVERQKQRRQVDQADKTFAISPFIFHRDGEVGMVGEFRKAWATATKKAKVSGYRFHGLRRFAAVAMRDAGIHQVTAMALTGHKTAAMWSRYAISNENDQRRALEKIDALRAAK
jgi:integrase